MKFGEILKAWGPVALWLGLMFFGSSDIFSTQHTSRFIVPFLHWLDPSMSYRMIFEVHQALRKAAHVSEYAILTGLLFRALRWSIENSWRRAAFALVPALLFAPADEFHQSFIPSRGPSAVDVLIDYCGAILGILICRVIHAWLGRRQKVATAAGENGPERI